MSVYYVVDCDETGDWHEVRDENGITVARCGSLEDVFAIARALNLVHGLVHGTVANFVDAYAAATLADKGISLD